LYADRFSPHSPELLDYPLLNATFGNAPELLISSAALRSGFYRVVQLAMLGSMLTNLLFVFGVSCLVGGLRWQVQELRITSGNVSVMLLLVATAGSLLPAALNMSGQMEHKDSPRGIPSDDELNFSRINAFVLICMYVCYLLFQLGTHKEEFDDDENIVETPDNLLIMSPHFTSRHGRKKRAERNHFCMKWFSREMQSQRQGYATVDSSIEPGALNKSRTSDSGLEMGAMDTSDLSDSDESEPKNEEDGIFRESLESVLESRSLPSLENGSRRRHRRTNLNRSFDQKANPVVVTRDIVITSKKPVESLGNDVELNGDMPASSSNSEERSTRKFASFSPCHFAVATTLTLMFCSTHVAAGWHRLVIHHYSMHFSHERHSR
jgi:Ca2+/Na+ antiporter